ncbi:MAG: hypothetical protein EXS05_21855 [Planctomycetaceae bacterium]|nr:hypothetical protein [Planctomycetaceae bacterium]
MLYLTASVCPAAGSYRNLESAADDVTDAFFHRRSCDELLALDTLTTSKTKAELFVIEGVVML